MRTRTNTRAVAELLSKSCRDEVIAEILSALLPLESDPDYSDWECRLGGEIFDHLATLRPEAVDLAVNF